MQTHLHLGLPLYSVKQVQQHTLLQRLKVRLLHYVCCLRQSSWLLLLDNLTSSNLQSFLMLLSCGCTVTPLHTVQHADQHKKS